MRKLGSLTISIGVLTIFSVLSISAQTKTFSWSDELCDHSGTYDGKKFTQTQLQNTLELSKTGAWPFTAFGTVFKFEDIANLDIAAFDAEYRQKSDKLKTLDIVETPFWENLRQRKIRELDQLYLLTRTTMRAYTDPKALREYKAAPSCTAKFAEPLIAGGDQLLAVWRSVNEESRKKNGDPERVRRTFEEQFASADKMNFALVEVMAFGWFNCANDLVDHVVYDAEPEKQFKKLFKAVKTIRCDEP